MALGPASAGAAIQHWAFAEVRAVPAPAVHDTSWPQTPLDRFILARLEAAKITPAAPATREVLIRRLTFNLTGLPPAHEAVAEFVADTRPDAIDRVIERLLASPAYGERWARHWLDLARYAETDGFEHDALRPHAWRYRDYVVRAFNTDRPFDRFIREQLAGDEFWPDDAEARVATGFNLLGPDMVDSADQVQRRLNTLNDMTDTTAAVFLGITLSCARCHDHKSEPFTQRDYYQIQACFAPAVFRSSPLGLEVTNGPAPSSFVLVRGDYQHPGDAVVAGVPGILSASAAAVRFPVTAGGGRRRALADWIASPANPLTARVLVNRVWQHHFGRGLVASPSDFGTQGARPVHPELLDWLADDFTRNGWSLKHLHRLIVRSAAWQQSLQPSPIGRRLDPANKLWSRQERRRLDGEELRDSLLAISGLLDGAMGGPGVSPPLPAELAKAVRVWQPETSRAAHHRRSLYVLARRNLRFPFLEVFDAPDSNLSCALRGCTTTAPQSLALLNSREVMTAAVATARRVEAASSTSGDRISRAFREILGRSPTAAEAARSAEFLTSAPLTELCRALFNLNAFVYVE